MIKALLRYVVLLIAFFFCAVANAQEVSPSPFLVSSYAEYEINLEDARSNTERLIKQLIEAAPKVNEDIVFGYWAIQHVYANDNITSHWEAEGHWIKFYEDFTYQIGIMDKVLSLGSYFYDINDMTLMLLDAQSDQQPKAWRLALEGTDASLIGRAIYGVSNGAQIKLNGVYKQPSPNDSK